MSEEIDVDAFWSDDAPEADVVVETPAAVEEVVEEVESVDADATVEEHSPDALDSREAELQVARDELAAEAEAARAQYVAPPDPIRGDTMRDLMSQVDVRGIRVPHPIEEGKTMSLSEAQREFPGISDYTNTLVAAVYDSQRKEGEALNLRMENMTKLNTVYRAHPDAESLVPSGEFQTWFGDQTENVQTLFNMGSGADINLVIGRYKETLTPVEPEVVTPVGLRAPANGGGTSQKAPSNSDLFMTDAEIDAFWKD